MDAQHEYHDLSAKLRRLLAAALAADISPARIEGLIRLERRKEAPRCPECSSTMRSEAGPALRCTHCGVTSAMTLNP